LESQLTAGFSAIGSGSCQAYGCVVESRAMRSPGAVGTVFNSGSLIAEIRAKLLL